MHSLSRLFHNDGSRYCCYVETIKTEIKAASEPSALNSKVPHKPRYSHWERIDCLLLVHSSVCSDVELICWRHLNDIDYLHEHNEDTQHVFVIKMEKCFLLFFFLFLLFNSITTEKKNGDVLAMPTNPFQCSTHLPQDDVFLSQNSLNALNGMRI